MYLIFISFLCFLCPLCLHYFLFCILFRGTLICLCYHILQFFFFCIYFLSSLSTWAYLIYKAFFLFCWSLFLKHIFSYLCHKGYGNVNFFFPLSQMFVIYGRFFFSHLVGFYRVQSRAAHEGQLVSLNIQKSLSFLKYEFQQDRKNLLEDSYKKRGRTPPKIPSTTEPFQC